MARPQKFRHSRESLADPQVARQLGRLVLDIEMLRAKRSQIDEQIAAAFDAVDDAGFEKKFVRQVIAIRGKDENARFEQEQGIEAYEIAIEKGVSLVRTRREPDSNENFPPHDAVTGELTEEQESIPSADRANPEHVDVDRSAERASSAVEVGATNSPERARSMRMTPLQPREANGLKGFGFTVNFEDPAIALLPDAAGQTGEDATTPLASSPVVIPDIPTFLIKTPAKRPHCLNPGENCGGQGVRHCYSCVKAMAESGVAA